MRYKNIINNIKTMKKIILEQGNQYYNKSCEGRYNDKILRQACNFKECHPEDAVSKTVGGVEYMSFPSKGRPGTYAFLSTLSDGGSGTGEIRYSEDPDGKSGWVEVKNVDGKLPMWACPDLKETIDQTMTLDQQAWFNSLKKNYPNKYFTYTEGIEKNAPGSQSYKLVKLKEIDEMAQMPGTKEIQELFVWVYEGESQQVSNQSKEVVNYFKNTLKYKEKKDINPAELELYVEVNLKDDPNYGNQFVTDYFMYYDPNTITAASLQPQLENAIKKANKAYDKKSCRNVINLYYTAYEFAKTGAITRSQKTIDQDKAVVRACKKHNFPMLKKKLDELENANPITTSTGAKVDFSLAVRQQSNIRRENVESKLKGLIRESLIEIKEQKKKTLSEESKIVKGRLQFITENSKFRTKKERDYFCKEVLSEMVYLNSQGFNKEVINEEFFDILKGLFGNAGESTIQYFKEYLAKWLIESLTPFDTEGWVGGTIVKAIGNLPIGDIPKLTDCNFTTKLLSKSLAEEAVDQLKRKAGLEGAFYDILRNAVIESLSESDMGQKIESALGKIICPMLSKVSGKMDSAAQDMKKGALSLK
jgi:hypothetical protein